MSLAINQLSHYSKINYCQNTNFRGKNVENVFRRPASEIADLISCSKERLNGKSAFYITDGLISMVGQCLGDKYLFKLAGTTKSNFLWVAIRNEPEKAMEVIERILKDSESQGKSYNEIVDKMIAELKPQEQKSDNLTEALRSTIAPQVERSSSAYLGGKSIKTSLNFEELSEYQKDLINDAKRKLAYNKNVSLYTTNIGWGSYINPSSNPNMFLYLKSEDFRKITDINEAIPRLSGDDAIFQFSVLGSDKKALIKIPAEELTPDMGIINTSMRAGIHPFLIDMAKYLDKHPEAIKIIESSVGEINLSSVDSSIMEKINACK